MSDKSRDQDFDKNISELTKRLGAKFSKIKDPYEHCKEFFPIDEIGDLKLDVVIEKHYAMRVYNLLPVLDSLYERLTIGKHFSKKGAFDNVHTDQRLWVIPCEGKKIIVEGNGFAKIIYIKDECSLHIRKLSKKATIKQLKKQKFKPPSWIDRQKEGWKFSKALNYGNASDIGYILSISQPTLKRYVPQLRYIIFGLEFWEKYLGKNKNDDN